MSEICTWLHESLLPLPLISYPFDLESIPKNGIYFFYERGEMCSHLVGQERIVRIGTHRDGNFRNRISEHYLLNERKMDFGENTAAPHDRSIFRKNLGRVLLNKSGDTYLEIWERSFTSRKAKQQFGHLRDLTKEREIEKEVSRILRECFSFRYIAIEDQVNRMGPRGLEKYLIGTVSRCEQCRSSEKWFGTHSPIQKIQNSGLWQVQHLTNVPLSEEQKSAVQTAIEQTMRAR